MSCSKCCFLTYIQVSQETGKVVGYSQPHLCKNFPQLVVIHRVKGFSIVSEAKVDVFLEFVCFFYDPTNIGNLISGFSPFSTPTLYIESSQFTYCWSLAWKILRLTLRACKISTTVRWCEHFLVLPFFGTGVKTDLFQSWGHCWVFQICWCIECSILTASSFSIWNSSARIPSPPLALFIVILPKAHLTSHSRMSPSKWVATPSWLSKLLRPFLCIFSVYSWHLFLISSAC